MKKVFFMMVATVCLSCSKSENSGNKSVMVSEEEAVATKPVTDPNAEGKVLIEGADCLGCHKMDEKLIGPSYKEVASKYENTPQNVEMLADRIIKGSSGMWGDVPMPAHGFSRENAKFMAQYILSSK